jgi:hypothetical protein
MPEPEATFLQLLSDPARRAEAARVQAERRAERSDVTTRTPAEANYLFGVARAELALAHVEAEGAASRLAEGYALQGFFAGAAAVEQDEERKMEYEAKALAVAHLGAFQCGDPETQVERKRGDAKGQRVPLRHPVEEVYDGSRFLTLFVCRVCGAYSAEVKP